MQLKRIFAAIKIYPEKKLLDAITSIRNSLKNEKIRWEDIEKTHITTKFFGDTDTWKIKDISEVFRRVCAETNHFEIEIEKVGVFDSFLSPKVLWLGINQSDRLTQFYDKINEGLQTIGYEKENRAFNPHLTLGRIKSLTDNKLLQKCITEFANVKLQIQPVDELPLYESLLGRDGSFYQLLESYNLK